MKPDAQLIQLADLFKERNQQYGNSYKETGKVFEALFPNGIKIDGELDFNRFCILVQIVGKLNRYCNNFAMPLSSDHLKDISVYATMLLELDGGKG